MCRWGIGAWMQDAAPQRRFATRDGAEMGLRRAPRTPPSDGTVSLPTMGDSEQGRAWSRPAQGVNSGLAVSRSGNRGTVLLLTALAAAVLVVAGLFVGRSLGAASDGGVAETLVVQATAKADAGGSSSASANPPARASSSTTESPSSTTEAAMPEPASAEPASSGSSSGNPSRADVPQQADQSEEDARSELYEYLDRDSRVVRELIESKTLVAMLASKTDGVRDPLQTPMVNGGKVFRWRDGLSSFLWSQF